MSNQTTHQRLRHFVILVPLGLGVGAVVGYLFGDLTFGLLSGIGLGVLIAAVFAIQAH